MTTSLHSHAVSGAIAGRASLFCQICAWLFRPHLSRRRLYQFAQRGPLITANQTSGMSHVHAHGPSGGGIDSLFPE
jgi:hypothetical protein